MLNLKNRYYISIRTTKFKNKYPDRKLCLPCGILKKSYEIYG